MIDPEVLIGSTIETNRADYDRKTAILYALGTGCGIDPLDVAQRHYLEEERLRVMPTLSTVLGYKGFWAEDPRFGIDAGLAVQASQEVIIHKPLPPAASIRRDARIVGVTDKGAGRGALVSVIENIRDAAEGTLLATLGSVVLCRADGGCGDAGVQARKPAPCPDRQPDKVIDVPTSTQQAQIYKLSGDDNPLHFDPAIATRAGFERPILQGLSTFGAACRELTIALCANDPDRMHAMSARFTGFVFPGDLLRLQIWLESAGLARFRLIFAERKGVAIDCGLFRFRG